VPGQTAIDGHFENLPDRLVEVQTGLQGIQRRGHGDGIKRHIGRQRADKHVLQLVE
jgi:hypothetical protein